MNNYLSCRQTIKGYQIQSLLGKGAFGQVYKAINPKNQQQVAIKVIELQRFKEHGGILGNLVQSEIRALDMVKSEHVVGYVESFQDDEYCYIVMEFCDSGDLEQQLKKPNLKLTEQDALGIIKQILKGLRDLHALYIIHRDLKIQNILIHNNSIYKIADLGFCKLLQNQDQQSKLQLGSLYTMAPEIFNQQKYGLSSDMFSVGVIFYQILFNRFPFAQKDYLQSVQPNINFQKNKIEVSELTQDLLNQMLQFDPQKRITFENLINHPAFGKPIFSMISKIQLQANRIPFDDYQDFYKQKSKVIEQMPQNTIDNQQMQQIKIKQLNNQNQNNVMQINELKQISDNQLSLEIDKINQKINQMYFFSNTFQEIIHSLQQPNIMAIICLQLQKFCESILKMIVENMKKFENQKQYLLDFHILQEQYREMATLSEGILYQVYDIQEQLKKFNETHLAQFISKTFTEKEFILEFNKQLKKQLQNEQQNITKVQAHVILCYLFCQTQNSYFLQFDETTFNLQNSKEQYINQRILLQKFNEVSQKIEQNSYNYDN